MDIIGNILTIDCCYNLDCNIGMQMMKEQELIADWCITDPPYGIGAVTARAKDSGRIKGKCRVMARHYEDKSWDDERIGGGLHTTYKRSKQRADYIRWQLLCGYTTADKKLGSMGQAKLQFDG